MKPKIVFPPPQYRGKVAGNLRAPEVTDGYELSDKKIDKARCVKMPDGTWRLDGIKYSSHAKRDQSRRLASATWYEKRYDSFSEAMAGLSAWLFAVDTLKVLMPGIIHAERRLSAERGRKRFAAARSGVPQ